MHASVRADMGQACMKEDAYAVRSMLQPKFKESMVSQDYYGKYLTGSLKDGLRCGQAYQSI